VVDQATLSELRSVEELANYKKSIDEQLRTLDEQSEGQQFGDEDRARFEDLADTSHEIEKRIAELEGRKAILKRIADGNPERLERAYERVEKTLNGPEMSGSRKEQDIYDLRTIRSNPTDPDRYKMELRDRALRAIELTRDLPEQDRQNPHFPTRNEVERHLEKLMERTQQTTPGEVARLILNTGSPVYRRAFWKNVVGLPINNEEQRALSLAGSGGGFAIPFALDPSIIPTSNSVVNPARALGRLVTISGANTWQGVTSPAISASRVAEGTEASDNATTLVQPSVTVTKAHAFVPFSIEIGEEWPALEAEFNRLLQDAKDDEEGTAFVTGAGTGVNPQGFVTGASTTFAFPTGLTITALSMYNFEAALPPRFRPRESFVANRGIYNVVRGIDTAGGAALWLYMAQGLVTQAPTPGNTGATLLGRGAWEGSAMQSTIVNATKIMVVGDFTYFLIVDRIGMTVELVPHIFGPVSRFPIGQRGLYAYWRNSSKVLSSAAFVAGTGTT